MHFKDRSVLFLATGCFVGYAPAAPGTLGSVIALPICYLLSRWHVGTGVIFTVLFIVVSIWIAHRAEKLLGAKDPGCIVIDEIAGMLVTFVSIPFHPVSAIGGFVLFRGFDIAKPFPIRWAERRLSGGAGIVMDDIIAGVFANILLRIFLIII